MSDSADRLPANRSFGLLFTGVFALMTVRAWIHGGSGAIIFEWTVAALATATITLLRPDWLAPFNKGWFLFGKLLGKIISPIVLGIIFLILVTPVGLIVRLFGRDELRLRRPRTNTYWIDRDPSGITTAEFFKNQF